ncbi:major facilitator superfamily domain-containing protein 9-like [Galleria mellonella]|uniref:Major facilitator superfamily domain-containing protein 9-like n=1 Tax=Galleria mellonella TaxID=7137 RepID=A0A6J1WTD3_GALME|nr:major facilitator superfamily domain-containing protein 9-like [Galleria mellonella]
MSFSICLLQTIAFLDLLAVGLIVPLVPGHVRKMGANHIYVGLLGSIYAGFQLGSGPLIGSLSDLKGRKAILMMTLLICALAYTIIGLTPSIAMILVIRAVLGLFKQTQMLTKALVPDYEKNEQKQSGIYGKMAAISGAGITLGPVIGGHIAEDNPENGFTFIAVVVGFCFIFNAGLAYFLPKTSSKKRSKGKSSKNTAPSKNIIHSFIGNIKQSVIELYKVKWSEYWDIFLFKALIGFTMGVYYSNYSLYLKTQYQLTPKYVGYVISFQGVIGSISSFFIGYINNFYTHDIDYSLRNFHVFVLLSVSLSGLIVSYNVFTYIIWLVPLAIGNAIGRLVTLEMILKRSHGDHRGTLIGASNSVRSLSGVIAPMVAGFIGEYFGVAYVIYASFCSTILGLALSYQYRYKQLKID